MIEDSKDKLHDEECGLENEKLNTVRMFRKPFSFKGRIRRMEYGISVVICFVYCFVFTKPLLLRYFTSFSTEKLKYGLLLLLVCFPASWFLFAQGAKRSHDINHSGWYQIIPYYWFWLLFPNSQEGINDYGANPKGK